MSSVFNTFFIVGASRGIGLELVKQLLQSNPNRIVHATTRSHSDSLAQLQQEVTTQRLIIHENLDVNNDESTEALVQKLLNQNVKIDVLINNAGIIGKDSIGSVSRQELSNMLQTNTFSPIIVSQKFYNNQLINQNGLIVNISSIIGSIELGIGHVFNSASYAISKAALNMVSKLQSLAFAEGKVNAISLHPGWLQTQLGGQNAPLSVDVGVSGIVKVIDNFNQEQNGTFLQYDGTPVKL
ncbi:predicted protein [Naegleria gruberi]|uniref:Predicted protein n=1 Tax=Naegleria gruberi TaxID=5762 RepID=D2V9N0_NAEGR|nr:uncharacterized protein NAEGRDRAFT_32179 [Naegleria gruberi]EFC46495.1 predicted protein [Naegleria gruberi]|eukprot:XP_002679239.1 predicted protein [Naegleria gruberi strain NEG-M]